jgi:hypothetical protein
MKEMDSTFLTTVCTLFAGFVFLGNENDARIY